MPRNPTLLLSLALLTPTLWAAAEDFKLNDGTVFREARVLEVRPDALILSHSRGVAMADLEKLAPAIRARYHYDPNKAAEFRKREEAARQASAAENRRLVAAHEQRQMDLARAQFQASEAASAPQANSSETQFSYRVGAIDRSYASSIARVGAEIEKAEQTRIARDLEATTFWGSPVVKFISGVLGGVGPGTKRGEGSEPRNWR